MKPDVVSGLANATWPVLLLDEAGVIHNANPAAVDVFGPTAATGSTSISGFWPDENGVSAVNFLLRAENSSGIVLPLKLIGQTGISQAYQACVCFVPADGRK